MSGLVTFGIPSRSLTVDRRPVFLEIYHRSEERGLLFQGKWQRF
jgi:hypothetical protein